LPVIGTAFASKSVTRDESELLVLVSPEIVHPMDPDEVPYVLPGTDITEPKDLDLYLHSRLEGNPSENFRSTVWPEYRARVEQAKHRANKNGWVAYPADHAVSPAAESHYQVNSPDIHVQAAATNNGPATLVTGRAAPNSGIAKQPSTAEATARQKTGPSAVRQASGFRPISQGQGPQLRPSDGSEIVGARGFSDE
jgi:Flp pilus assembly secretin CpaC